MIQKIKRAILTLGIVLGLGTAVFATVPVVGAVNPIDDACNVDSSSVICKGRGDSAGDLIKTVINVLLFVVGIIAVIMIIIGGILYVISSGDSGKITKAKDTILYAVIGLVVAFLAYAVVNWVVGKLS